MGGAETGGGGLAAALSGARERRGALRRPGTKGLGASGASRRAAIVLPEGSLPFLGCSRAASALATASVPFSPSASDVSSRPLPRRSSPSAIVRGEGAGRGRCWPRVPRRRRSRGERRPLREELTSLVFD